MTGRSRRRATKDALVDAAFAAGWSTVRAVPERAARRAFDVFAEASYRRNGRSVHRLRGNLRRVLGPDAAPADLERLTRDGLRSYLRYWCEVFRLPSLDTATVVARFHVTDEHHLRDAYARGRGLILALPHMGNWDHAGAWLTGTGVPFTTVAERLRPERLFDRFVAFRESIGMEVIPLTGAERAPFGTLAARLRAGGCLCLLADRDLTTSGVDVEFFGGTARMPAGPAALALSTGAPLVPVTLWYDGPVGTWARIHPPVDGVDPAALTQALAGAFEAGIREHPADWHMFQRVWVDQDRDG